MLKPTLSFLTRSLRTTRPGKAASSLRSRSSRIKSSDMAGPPALLRPLVQLDPQGRGPLVEHLLLVGVRDDHPELGGQPPPRPPAPFERDRPVWGPPLRGGRPPRPPAPFRA